jgi:glycine/D-amino acid oxidase-like deaminating enzyme
LEKPSVAVIGAGVAGLNTALRASELGCEVTVVERDRPASGSSSRSAGVFNISSTEPLQVEVRVRTRELLEKYEREDGLRLARIGYIRLARSESHVKMFEDVIALQRELGAEPAEIVEPVRLRELVPHLRTDDLVAAIYNPRDGCMDGVQLCGVLAARAEAQGARIVPRTRVEGHEVVRGRHRLHTGAGPVEADVVVNAAGPWAMEVGELLGHPLPLVNQVNEVIRVKLPPAVDYSVPMVQEYIPGEEQAGYFRQDGRGGMIAGMHTYSALGDAASADPDTYQEAVAWETMDAVTGRVGSRLPVDGLGFEPGWAGLYPVSADGEYVVGPYAADPTVFACGGFSGQGLIAACSVGPVAAEWIVFGEPRSLPGAVAWRPDRPGLR